MQFVVTGAGKGLGFEIVKKCLTNPENYVLAISRSCNALEKLKSDNKISDKQFHIVECDFEKKDEFNSLINTINMHYKRIDVLINNAGILGKGDFLDYDISEAHSVFEVNFFAPARLIQHLLPLLQEGETKHVVNIGSMGGFQGSEKFPGLSYYSASKAALACLSECLAREFSDTGVSFNCLALGSVQTEMLNLAFPGYKAQQIPSDMAGYIYDFACNSGSFINGKIIPLSKINT